MKVLVTGSAGFIGGYLVRELLRAGHDVVGLDNLSKYGHRPTDHPFIEGDAKDAELLKTLLDDCDHFVAGAAIIGGISLFHARAYDLLAENERITASSFDAAIRAHRERRLQKITVVSSSMVFESTSTYPTEEGEERRSPPPQSTYGFQKLATEYFAQGAWEQYKLPYTIVRPFNCVGIGETQRAMSHVVPDLVRKVLAGENPLHILGNGNQVRHYTYGGDLARGIRLAIESPAATNEDFNLSTPQSTTVLELAQLIWRKINGNAPFDVVCDPPFPYDVQRRIPSVEKAKRLLGFEATTPLDVVLDEIIDWIRKGH